MIPSDEEKQVVDEKTVIMLPYTPEDKDSQVSIVQGVKGILNTDIPGVRLLFGTDNFYIENKARDERVRVNGRVLVEKKLSTEDEIDLNSALDPTIALQIVDLIVKQAQGLRDRFHPDHPRHGPRPGHGHRPCGGRATPGAQRSCGR